MEGGTEVELCTDPSKGKATGGPRGKQAPRGQVGSRSNALAALCFFLIVALGQLKDYKEAIRGTKENWSHDPVILGTWGPL